MRKFKSIRILIAVMMVVLLGSMGFNCDVAAATQNSETQPGSIKSVTIEDAGSQLLLLEENVRDYEVEIIWSDGNEAHRNDSVVVKVYRDGEYCATESLSRMNEWKYTPENLPLKDENGTYYTYTVWAESKDGYGYEITYPKDEYEINAGAQITYTNEKHNVDYVFCGEVPEDAEKYLPAQAKGIIYGTNFTSADTSAIAETGYTFRGWYTDDACSLKYKDGTALKKDMTLYGYWEKLQPGDDDDDDDVTGGTGTAGDSGIDTGDRSPLILFMGMLFISLVEASAIGSLKHRSRH